MAAAAILNVLFLSILVTLSTSGSSRLHYCKISFNYVNWWLNYCCLCKNPRSHIDQILRVGSYPGYLSWFQVSLSVTD